MAIEIDLHEFKNKEKFKTQSDFANHLALCMRASWF